MQARDAIRKPGESRNLRILRGVIAMFLDRGLARPATNTRHDQAALVKEQHVLRRTRPPRARPDAIRECNQRAQRHRRRFISSHGATLSSAYDEAVAMGSIILDQLGEDDRGLAFEL